MPTGKFSRGRDGSELYWGGRAFQAVPSRIAPIRRGCREHNLIRSPDYTSDSSIAPAALGLLGGGLAPDETSLLEWVVCSEACSGVMLFLLATRPLKRNHLL